MSNFRENGGGLITSFTCALTGEQNISDPVATPSGFVCSRKFLLNVLLENKGKDPFVDGGDVELDESQLIDLKSAKTSSSAVPPMVGTSTGGISSILTQLDNEYHGLLMELFTTKRSLQQTKEELSTALYQHDAAIRVIARLAMERDEARSQLQQYITSNENSTKKRTRDTSTEQDAEPAASKPKTTSSDESHVQIMMDTWQHLSTERKGMKKATPVADYSTLISSTKQQDDSLQLLGSAKGSVWAAVSKDSITIQPSNVSIPLLTDCWHDFVALPNETDKKWMLVMISKDGINLEVHTASGKQSVDIKNTLPSIIDVHIHPSGQYLIITCVDTVAIFSIQEMSKCQQFPVPEEEKISFSQLHPDGLLHAIGTCNGKILLMEIKSQTLASTLELPDTEMSVESISFSENGYHLVTCCASKDKKVMHLWDLRKQKLLYSQEDITLAKFDLSGKYVAMVSGSTIYIASVKDWKKQTPTSIQTTSNTTSLIWTNDTDQVLLTTSKGNDDKKMILTAWKSGQEKE